MDKVVHFEIPFDNEKRAQNFYSKVFGWKLNPIPEMKYTIVHTVEVDDKQMPKEAGAINGGMMKREQIKNPVITINVSDIKKSAEKIKKEGGRIVMEPFKVGDMGTAAYFKDTEGNVIGLWENAMK
jgi:predicted enzyme related to lactoylglutathione lyase